MHRRRLHLGTHEITESKGWMMIDRRALIAVGGAVVLLGAVTPPLFAAAEVPGLGTTTTAPSGGGPTTTAPGGSTTSTGAEYVLPAGFEFLVDDTNRITVAVPDTWSDVSTAANTVDGALVPSINAATDLDVWDRTFDAPGVLYAAFPYTADPQTLIDRLGLPGGCASDTVVPYADGVFTGSWAQWSECGANRQAAWHLIVASPTNRAFTAAVIVQLAGPQDQQALDVVLNTFNTTASATWPAAEASPSSTVPPTTVPITTVAATTLPATTVPAPTTTGLPAIGVRLVDETNFLTVTVPASWTDHNLANSRHDDGSERATITASPDINQFYETWEGSGTHLLALPPTTEPAALLNQFAYPGPCTDGGITPYSDGRFTGQRQTWLNCDGLSTRVVNVAARPGDGSFTMFIQVQQATPDDAALSAILASAGPVSGAVYPTPSASAPLTPTGPVPPELLTVPGIPLTSVADDAGRLSISVPGSWTETDIGAQLNDDASDRPRVAAAPILDDFYSDWEAPGVQVVAYPFTDDPSTLLSNLGFADRCDDGGVQSFSNGTLTGLMQTWTACGDTASRNVLLAVSPADQSVTVFVEVQLPDQDNSPLQAVLSSLRVA